MYVVSVGEDAEVLILGGGWCQCSTYELPLGIRAEVDGMVLAWQSGGS